MSYLESCSDILSDLGGHLRLSEALLEQSWAKKDALTTRGAPFPGPGGGGRGAYWGSLGPVSGLSWAIVEPFRGLGRPSEAKKARRRKH